ncbi:hypothetical protein PENARI_c005G11846 [Penicillium arizonense]|uniref:Enoyl reductase (ER) domain-containing protein n=1 Tax=Penicillium arizonense TaxID=1835702 RepID=A0A1F5LQ86_PENAI|nr:hypothetical protein PENARI_c005G11846 [Penicillium arizonense]OGE55099.1 hypothetical protein PENARI_c005G11846 [Penicillium arizonense]
MRAVQFYGAGDLRVEDVQVPQLDQGTGKVLVEVEWCGICGSDLHLYTSGTHGSSEPFIMGHEFCGVVKEVPLGSNLTVGDKVIVNPTLTCESCVCCSSGWGSQCPKLKFIGFTGGPGGGLSEFVAVQEYKLHKVPEHFELEYAALAEPLAVGLHAVRKAAVRLDDWPHKMVLLLGGGPVGYAVLENMIALGADPNNIIISEPEDGRHKLLNSFGVQVLSPTKDNIGTACKTMTKSKGIDIAFDCAGKTGSAAAAMALLRPRGTYINVAFWGANITFPFIDFFKKEITCVSSMAYSGDDFREAVNLMSMGKYRTIRRMVTARFSLENADNAFQGLLNNKEHHTKILLTPKKSNLVAVNK